MTAFDHRLAIYHAKASTADRIAFSCPSSRSTDWYRLTASADGTNVQCSCPGFAHRGTCKHAAAITAILAQHKEMSR